MRLITVLGNKYLAILLTLQDKNLHIINLTSFLASMLAITKLEVMIFHATSFPGSFLTVNDDRKNVEFCLLRNMPPM